MPGICEVPAQLLSEALAALLRSGAAEQVWLPQAPPAESEGAFLIDRFKSPELVLLSDWLAAAPEMDRAAISRQLLETYAFLLGRALAAAHAAPLLAPEGESWKRRWMRLGALEASVTYPQCAFDAESAVPFSDVFASVGRELCRGLQAAWPDAIHRLIPDPAAARAARGAEAKDSIEAFVDFGGLTVQITVRLQHAQGRPAPFLAGSSMSYLLGGERLIDAAAFAQAGGVREEVRARARRVSPC